MSNENEIYGEDWSWEKEVMAEHEKVEEVICTLRAIGQSISDITGHPVDCVDEAMLMLAQHKQWLADII